MLMETTWTSECDLPAETSRGSPVIVLIVAVLYTWVVVIRATCDAVVFTLYNRAGVIKSLRAATIPVREHARVEGAVRAKGSARKVNSPRRILARYIEGSIDLRGTLQRRRSVCHPIPADAHAVKGADQSWCVGQVHIKVGVATLRVVAGNIAAGVVDMHISRTIIERPLRSH